MTTWQFGGFAPDFIGPDRSPISVLQTFSGTVLDAGALFTLDVGTKSYSDTGAATVGLSFNTTTGKYTAAGAVTPGTYAKITRCSGSDTPPSYTEYSWTLVVNALLAFPQFSGPIDDQVTTNDLLFETSSFATGQTSYAISSTPAGFAFNTGTGRLTVTVASTGFGVFGPFTVTYTNSSGSVASNGFLVTVLLPDTGGGGGDYSDETLQRLLDPVGNFTGIRIIRRMDAAPTVNYYVVPNQVNRGRAKWVEVLSTDDAVARANKIIISTSIPAQPTWPLP